MGQVWDIDLPPAQQLVLLALTDHADHTGGNIYPSFGLIAWKTGYSERQVRRIVKQLENDKLLVRVATRPGKSTVYRVDLSAGHAKEPYVAKASADKMTADNMSYDKMSPRTSQGKNETHTPDIASLKMTTNRHKEEPLKAKEKEKELLSVLDVPGNPDEKISPEQQREAVAIFSALVAKVSPPQKQPFTDDEIQAQVAIALARQKARQIAAEAQT